MCLVDSLSSTCNGLCNYPWNLQHMHSTIFFFFFILSPALMEVTDIGAITT